MKNTNYKVLILLFTITLSYGQCPPANAIKYKNDAAKMGADEFSKQQAYIFLATYYNYKCQCDNGVDQPVRMAETINNLVDTYSAYTKNAYGTINKVLTCKSKDGGTSIESGETGDPNASNHGSGITLEPIKSWVEELSTDLGITQNEISMILSGDFEGAADNMNRNRLTNQLTDTFSGNGELAANVSNALYNTAEAIGNKIWEDEVREGKKMLNQMNEYNSNYISFKKPKTSLNFSEASNFNSKNWKLIDNNFFASSILENNEIEITYKAKTKIKDLREKDIYFASLDIEGFDVTQDFNISFEIGYPTGQKTLNNITHNCPYVGLFLSETNIFETHPTNASFRNSFTPIVNRYTKPLKNGLGYLRKEFTEFYFLNIMTGHYAVTVDNISTKLFKGLVKKYKKINKEKSSKYYYVKYQIIKKNDKAQIILYYPDEGLEINSNKLTSKYFDFKFKDSNKIYFGASAIKDFIAYQIYFPKVEKIRIRNFTIK